MTALWIAVAAMGAAIVVLGVGLLRERGRENAARRSAERARDRAETAGLELSVLQQVTALLSTAREPAEVADAILRIGLEGLRASSGAVLVYDPEREMLALEQSIGYPPGALDDLSEIPLAADLPVAVAVRTQEPVLLHDPGEIEGRFPRMTGVFRQVGRAGAIYPLLSEGRAVGGIVLVFAEDQTFDEAQQRGIAAFAAICGRALDRAREQQIDHDISITLQQSLLPGGMPALDGAEIAVRYLPAGSRAEVGGDWYDAVLAPDGRLVITIGDVGGKGIRAAALMGRLRIGLKAYAIEGFSPGEIVERLDRLALHLPETEFTTLAVVSLDVRSGRLLVCRAGHMPPLVVPVSGPPRLIFDHGSGPVGVGLSDPRAEAVEHLGPGDALLLYTDGLVESPGESLDAGLERLSAALAKAAGGDAEALADAAVTTRSEAASTLDDVAVLVVRSLPPDG